jgi:phage baseplate assembly protein W
MMDGQSAGKAFLGRGWAYPFSVAPDTGRIRTTAYEADVKEAIRIVLGTAKGERVMRPDFGCGIHELVFDAMSTTLLHRVEREVADALKQFEARIDVTGVVVDPTVVGQGRLDVSIDYRVRATNQPENLVYPFYFKEGA